MQYLFRLLSPSPHVAEQVVHASQGSQVFVSKSKRISFETYQFNSSLTDCLRGKEAWRPTHFSQYQTFFLHFPNELCYGYLRFEMGKFLWEGREK